MRTGTQCRFVRRPSHVLVESYAFSGLTDLTVKCSLIFNNNVKVMFTEQQKRFKTSIPVRIIGLVKRKDALHLTDTLPDRNRDGNIANPQEWSP